jgi:hypothetical protein
LSGIGLAFDRQPIPALWHGALANGTVDCARIKADAAGFIARKPPSCAIVKKRGRLVALNGRCGVR